MQTKPRKRLRVLVNGLSARHGGVQTYLINLFEHLPTEMAIEAFVLCPDTLPLPVSSKVKRLNVSWPVGNPFVRAVWEKIELPKLFRELRPDVFFCPGGVIGAGVPPTCKTVTMFRNMLPFDRVHRRKYPFGYMRIRHWLLERMLMRSMLRSDLVIFISNYARDLIEQRSFGRLKKTVIIPHGISSKFRELVSGNGNRGGWVPKEEYLLYVSRVDFYKAQIEVVQAFALLKKKGHTALKLVFAGPESLEYARKVRREIRRLALESEVVMLGAIPYTEMPNLYQNALVNIFASHCENCPNILLEALASGRPLVASREPPMPEFAGDAALYFNPSSPLELSECLSRLLNDPDRMRAFSRQALERSRAYSWLGTASATWKAVAELADHDLSIGSIHSIAASEESLAMGICND